MLTYNCKFCGEEFLRRRKGEIRVVYCSRSCHARDLIAGKNHNMKWIRVQEKLPEMGQQILVFTKLDELLSYKSLLIYQGVINPGITHWMPLKDPKEFRNRKT